MQKKVYIIEHDLISPIAIGRENIVDGIKLNKSADSQIKRLDVSGLPFRKGAEIKEDLSKYYTEETDELKALFTLDRKLELLATTWGKSKNRLGSILNKCEPERTGVILGIGAEAIPLTYFEQELTQFIDKKLNAISELITALNSKSGALNTVSNPYDIYTLYLAEKFNARAFQKSILTACVSSTQAIAQAYDSILRGKADVIIAGGTDSIINLIALISFGKLGVIPETGTNNLCRPFDTNRFGTIAGEAAGFVIMASQDFVNKHNLKPLASIIGYGNTLDGYKITAPDQNATAMSKAILDAIKQSKISANDYDYFYAHGTGTRQNDSVELKAIQTALGNHANAIPISSTKDRHGHAIAAAGIQELCILLELMKNDLIPGNLNLQNSIEPDMNLPKENFSQKINYALTSNFAFGGINTVLAVKNEQ